VRSVMMRAVDDVNADPHLLPGIRLHFDLEFIPPYDSFAASRAGEPSYSSLHILGDRETLNTRRQCCVYHC